MVKYVWLLAAWLFRRRVMFLNDWVAADLRCRCRATKSAADTWNNCQRMWLSCLLSEMCLKFLTLFHRFSSLFSRTQPEWARSRSASTHPAPQSEIYQLNKLRPIFKFKSYVLFLRYNTYLKYRKSYSYRLKPNSSSTSCRREQLGRICLFPYGWFESSTIWNVNWPSRLSELITITAIKYFLRRSKRKIKGKNFN